MEETKKFTIGEFTFDTFHEYRAAQEDLKKIECINKELDIHDPEVAVGVYQMIRSGQVVFHSPIGEQFSDHISDIVAKQNVGLLEDRAVIDEAEGKVKYQKYIGLFAVALGLVFFVYFGINELQDYLTARKYGKMAESTQLQTDSSVSDLTDPFAEESVVYDPDTGEANYSITTANPFEWSENIRRENLTILTEYRELLKENRDLAGWLSIEGTTINYPVVQCDDNEYYLTHSFDGEEDSNGTLFVDYRSDIVNEHSNTIIYGHNMKSDLMFGTLDLYLDEDYYNEHKNVTFNTIYEHRNYEIIAVCLSKVEYQDDAGVYRYYNFIQATNRAEWQAFLDNVKALSVYDFDVSSIEETDKFLTLSTCNSYTQDGRLFLVAKRVD